MSYADKLQALSLDRALPGTTALVAVAGSRVLTRLCLDDVPGSG
jgi:hypothetical protein